MIKVSPSLLAADPACLGDEVRKVHLAGGDELHFDVMDGHFVPNLTFGPHILRALKKHAALPCDVHLMLSDPLGFVDAFMDAGADILTVHAEANDWLACLEAIRARGIQAGVSLRPATPVSVLQNALPLIDRVLLMTVEPGFGGQSIQLDALGKARELRAMGFQGEIEADGGINAENMDMAARAGIDILVMGTAFFSAKDPHALCLTAHAL